MTTVHGYDPFVRGRFPVGVRTIEALDRIRGTLFPCEIWYPGAHEIGQAPAERNAAASPGTYPLVVFSHSSGAGRTQSTFLCTHLSSHGYVVAALDHSERSSPELARKEGETGDQRSARVQAWITNRVPDVRFLLDYLLNAESWDTDARLDPGRIGIVGHSFGGWTALAAPDVESRIGAIVALAPGGSNRTRPGIIPAKLAFEWTRDVATLYLVAENDITLPLEGMYELFERTPATKRMVTLRRADHLHFVDDVEQRHEAFRAMTFTGELAWINQEMRPVAELCSGEQAHMFVRALTLSHLDAVLNHNQGALRFLKGDIVGELALRSIGALVYPP